MSGGVIVSEHNLNEKVSMGEGSFDGNPHWGMCVRERVHVRVLAAGPLLAHF